jgi:hypothetical protein
MLHAVEAASSETPPAQEAASSIAQEAARYAVVRRMGSALRHQIAGALQPVSMMASLLERRAQAAAPQLEALRRNCSEMSAMARSASSESVALMGWLAPHDGERVALGKGVEECLHLLATELSFRGFTVVNATEGQDALVSRQALRTMLPACLMALTDACAMQAQVHVSARVDGAAASFALELSTVTDAPAVAQRAKAYRAVTWSDVQALAQAEQVELQMGSQSVQVRLDVAAQPAADSDQVRWG